MAAVEGVQLISDTILPPLYSPSSPPHPLRNAQLPLTPFDMANYNCHVCILYAFRPPMPDDTTMRDSLARALGYFPLLAGRIVPDDHGHTHVVVNDAGIRLKEATVPTPLESHLPFDPSATFMDLHPHPAEGVEVLLQIQLTRFSCGGITIGLTSHHRIGDGSAICHFLFTWARLARGLDIEVLPYFDWATVCTRHDPPTCDFDHLGVEFKRKDAAAAPQAPVVADVAASLSKMRNVAAHFSKELIAKLKDKVTGGDPNRRVSTFLCVLTHIWKKTTLARGLPDEAVTKVRVSVNGRQRIKPPIPTEYYGNLILWAFPKLTAGELLTGSYSYVAQVIRDAVNKVDDRYFKSFIDFGGLVSAEKGWSEMEHTMPGVAEFLNPNIEFNSWLSLDFHKLDFGSGTPCEFIPPGLPVEGLMILLPSCGEAGGVDVHMTLEKGHADTFQQVFHSLD
uniref:Agmatine coumaroyltransferase-2 n=1 Tax=Anthurium amnicola TaxID=1678845 RepID=A0A1D1Y4E8_9ARAE